MRMGLLDQPLHPGTKNRPILDQIHQAREPVADPERGRQNQRRQHQPLGERSSDGDARMPAENRPGALLPVSVRSVARRLRNRQPFGWLAPR